MSDAVGERVDLTPDDPKRVDDRYEVLAVLGRGGMGSAYRVRDLASGNELALKRLALVDDGDRRARALELFEREFHTLNQLAHPRIVRAFDYGLDGGNAYYTMELLDGGDLRGLAPMPWQEVCLVAYEVGSALSLLHSRQLVHRDLTPRNIRRTADGKAKVIDFGLLCPMGPISAVAGTPPYVAPELLASMTLDGRGDLFSLGATLYYALTGRVAFPARRFEQLRDMWRGVPPAPSSLVPGIPEAVDQLVLSMMRVDVGSRPKSAAEVMDRVRPLLPTAPAESLAISNAYLAAPALVGRDGLVVRMRKQVVRTLRRRGGGFMVRGSAGSGRSRMLDAFVLEARLLGATVARAGAPDAAHGPFGAAAALARQVHAGAATASAEVAARHPKVHAILFDGQPWDKPSRMEIAERNLRAQPRADVQAALRTWMHGISDKRALALVVDDLEQVDEPSAALLASLSLDADRRRIMYAVATDADLPMEGHPALEILAAQARSAPLSPLPERETHALLAAVFGDVPHLQGLVRELFRLSAGKPRECMQLAQHLVDGGAIRYANGAWMLPAQVDPSLLPSRMEEALQGQLDGLSPLAREIGQLLALAVLQRLSRSQLCRMVGASTAHVDDALDALRRAHLVTGSPAGYALCHAAARERLTAALEPEMQARLHDRLATVYRDDGGEVLAIAHHALQGTDRAAGLDFLLDHARDSESRTKLTVEGALAVGYPVGARVIAIAHSVASELARPERDMLCLWIMLAGVAAHGEEADYYYRVPDAWLAAIKRDAGFHIWHSLTSEQDPSTRAIAAFLQATEAHGALGEGEYGLPPAEAIKQMMAYVVFSLAVGVRTLDLPLLDGLPGLLEPFAPLTPLVSAMQKNAQATRMHRLGQLEDSHALFQEVIEQVDAIEDADVSYLAQIRGALAQTRSEICAALGLPQSLGDDSDDIDPNQRVGAAYVRKVAALHAGDWEGAERHRQQAELLALSIAQGGMFPTLGEELEAHVFARDLTGLKAVRAEIHGMADKHAGWQPLAHVADAHYHRLRGAPEAAAKACAAARACQADSPIASPWLVHADAIEMELHTDAGRALDALALGTTSLTACERNGRRHLARMLSLAMARAEAALGQPDRALSRLQGVVEAQRALGVVGLLLGRTYEYAARISIGARDSERFSAYATLTAEHYRPGQSSVLGALYEHLLDEARAAGVGYEAAKPWAEQSGQDSQLTSFAHIKTAIAECDDKHERAQRALGLLCEDEDAQRGYLFLHTEAGLTLCAQNSTHDDVQGARHFAEQQLELELDDDVCTMTADSLTTAGTGASGITTFTGTAGTHYEAVVLRAQHRDAFAIVGVAVLTGARDFRDRLDELAPLVAKSLLESGDYRPAA